MGLTDSRGDINLRILPPICLYLFKRFRRLSVAMIDSHGRLEERKPRDWHSFKRAGRQWRYAKRERGKFKKKKKCGGTQKTKQVMVFLVTKNRVNLQLPVAVAPMNRFLGGFLFHHQ